MSAIRSIPLLPGVLLLACSASPRDETVFGSGGVTAAPGTGSSDGSGVEPTSTTTTSTAPCSAPETSQETTMTINHLRDLAAFLDQLDRYGVPRDPRIEKAFALSEHAASLAIAQPTPAGVLDFTPEQITDLWRHRVLTADTRWTGAASESIRGILFDEARAALRDHVPAILKTLRPKFDRAAKAVTRAAEAGITPNATAQDVIDLDSAAALTAWRELRPNAEVLSDIA